MIFEVQNHKVFIKDADSNSLDLVKKALLVFKKQFSFNPKDNPKWEVTNLFSRKEFSFPTGYLDILKDHLTKNKIDYKVVDKRVLINPHLKLFIKSEHEPWEHQVLAIESIKNNHTGIIVSPTASGKSLIIEHCVDLKKARTLILTPTRDIQRKFIQSLSKKFGVNKVSHKIPLELIEKKKLQLFEKEIVEENNAADKLNKIGKLATVGSLYNIKEPHSSTPKKMGGVSSLYGKKDEEEIHKKKGFSISSLRETWAESPEDIYLEDKKKKTRDKKIQKLKQKAALLKDKPIKYKEVYVLCYKALQDIPQEFLNEIECVVIDECHHASSEQLRTALLKTPNAYFRYALSATPWRDTPADTKLMYSAIGSKVIFDLAVEDAIEKEIIAKPNLIIINPEAPKVYMKDMKNWRNILEQGIIGNEVRNKEIVKKAKYYLEENHRNIFITVDEIAHIDILVKRFKDEGIEDIIVIHGEKPQSENAANVELVGKRDTGICIGTMSVGEGTDMPNIDVVILASGGKSSVRFLQRIGRGARRGDKGKRDFIVIDFFDWYNPTLQRHSLVRQEIFKKYFKLNKPFSIKG